MFSQWNSSVQCDSRCLVLVVQWRDHCTGRPSVHLTSRITRSMPITAQDLKNPASRPLRYTHRTSQILLLLVLYINYNYWHRFYNVPVCEFWYHCLLLLASILHFDHLHLRCLSRSLRSAKIQANSQKKIWKNNPKRDSNTQPGAPENSALTTRPPTQRRIWMFTIYN